ncbi:MAG: hypothetical protein ACRD1T_23295, partial [Acidimicrobiia bacterium]
MNEAGQPINDAAGNAGLELEYDEHGNQKESSAFDAAGEATLVRTGYYRTKHEHDEWGREKERRFFNLSEEPATETDKTGAHRVTWKYDDRGNVTSTKLYDTADEPIAAGEKFFAFAAHEQRATFDAQNRAETVAYFDQNGQRLMGPEGWHGYRIEYDKDGFASATSWFDGKRRPVNEKKRGAHRIEMVNDPFGQPSEERFFDTERNPISTLDGGHHLRKNEYDKAGNLKAQTYFDVDNNPVAD